MKTGTYPAERAPRQAQDGTWWFITLGGTFSVGHKTEAKAMANALRRQANSQKWAAINATLSPAS